MSPGEDGLIGIPFPEHSSELLCHLNDQRRSGLLCDLTLTSRGARYPTHRSVMAAVSLYFRRLFGAEEDGGEGGGGGFSVCQLDCVAPDALNALLEFAYTATLTIPSSAMRDVLRGAQLLGIQCVADACRDILGETAETEGEVAEVEQQQQRRPHQHDPPERVAATAARAMVGKASRRKTERKKVKQTASHHHHHQHHISSSFSNALPASPVSHSSPASDSLRSLPSTQPPSPEPPDDLHLRHGGLNGDLRAFREAAGRGAALNGEILHWLQEERAPRGDRPPPSVPTSNHKLSEEEEMEAPGDDGGALMGSTSVPTSAAGTAVALGGRKRKSQTPQQCPVCQKIIHGAGKLPRHMRTHTGEKPFQCTACGVRFTRNDKLKIHMRKHTGERPYPCPHCSARFLHSYDLKNHLSLHSGARPFECPLCHKAFAREDHLQRHRKGHSCLELRTRRPRRPAELPEDGGGGEEERGRQSEPPLEALSLPPHPSAFLARSLLEASGVVGGGGGGGGGSGAGPPLMFDLERERERSIALQAVAQLAPHRLAGYPEFFLRGLGMRVEREAESGGGGGGGGEARRRRSPATLQHQWANEEEEENGEKEAEEEEEE